MYITDPKLNATMRTLPIPNIHQLIHTLPTEHMWTSVQYNRPLIAPRTRTQYFPFVLFELHFCQGHLVLGLDGVQFGLQFVGLGFLFLFLLEQLFYASLFLLE